MTAFEISSENRPRSGRFSLLFQIPNSPPRFRIFRLPFARFYAKKEKREKERKIKNHTSEPAISKSSLKDIIEYLVNPPKDGDTKPNGSKVERLRQPVANVI